MSSGEQARSEALAAFVARAARAPLPPPVENAAREALADYLAVSIAGHDNEAVRPLRRLAADWAAPGGARILLGPSTTPAIAALVNATMTHAMDLDDVHYLGGGHPGGPCWSTALGLAEHRGLAEQTAIRAFVAGYEVMARLGGGGMSGVGRTLQHRGFHPTSVFGRAGAAATACVSLGLDAGQARSALGVAATTAGGLIGSFGTHAKPFHSGKAAMDGIMAAQMAEAGFVGAADLYDLGKGILGSFLAGLDPVVPALDFDDQWYVLRNGFKRFASCRATHAAIEAAQLARKSLANAPIEKVVAHVNPIAMVAAGKMNPQTGLEGRFSVSYCVSLALLGYRLTPFDFNDAVLNDPQVRRLIPRIEGVTVPGQSETAARLVVTLDGGRTEEFGVDNVFGHPDKPLGWDGLHEKFSGLVEPVLGVQASEELFHLAHGFGDRPGAIERISSILARAA